jgi:hypothetical protein
MTMQVALSNQRQRIPTGILAGFEAITNQELAFWADDEHLPADLRAYCGWELEYREAFGIEVYIDAESGELKRRR